MSAIRIFRPKKNWSISPATVLPAGLLLRLLRVHADYTVVIDDRSVGKIGSEQERVFETEPGEHHLRIRFLGLRRSEELRMSMKDGEEREFFCGTSGMGWPTLREATPEDVARRTSIGVPPQPGDPTSPN